MADVLAFRKRLPPQRVERFRTYCPIPFFVDHEITYGEFQGALEAGGMMIVPDPQHPGSLVVVMRNEGDPRREVHHD